MDPFLKALVYAGCGPLDKPGLEVDDSRVEEVADPVAQILKREPEKSAEQAAIDARFRQIHGETVPPNAAVTVPEGSQLEKRFGATELTDEERYAKALVRKGERTTRIEIDRYGTVTEFDGRDSLQRIYVPDDVA
jgi:hypothetical protein